MKPLLPLLTVLLLSASLVSAQETSTPTDWTTEQRCITAPSQPPEGWTYDGVIFTIDSNGVHARRSDFATPYYIAFTGEREFGQSGRFSPDGRWFAVPEGHVEVSSTVSYVYFIDAIRVYSTAPAHSSYTVANLQVGLTDSSYFPVEPVSWLDNEHFAANQWKNIHSSQITVDVFDPFTQEVTPLAASPYRGFVLGMRYGAPTVQKREDDGTDGYVYVLVDSDGATSTGTPLPITDATEHGVFDDIVQWTADNSQFAGVLVDGKGIDIFDRSGHLQDTIPVGGLLNDFRLAPIGGLLAFASREGSLHIANLATHTILDTCIETYFSPMFSPDGRELAFGLNFGGYTYILDLEAWQAYRIDLAAADVIGWYPLE